MTMPRISRRLVVSLAALSLTGSAWGQNGFAAAWGKNTDGQTSLDVQKYTQLDGGDAFTVALLSDGTIAVFGSNAQGQKDIPFSVDICTFVAAGAQHVLVVREDGKVRCWGDNALNQCDVPSDLATSKAVAGGIGHSMALTNAGSVRCWGDNSDGQCAVPGALGVVKAIAAGGNHSMAIRSDDTVVCWGDDTDGQSTPPLDLGSVLAIAGGTSHSVALTSNNEVRCWGLDDVGQSTPPAGATDVVAIAAGNLHTLALKRDGTVLAWGENDDNQTTVPTLDPISAIAAGGFHSLAIEANARDCDDDGTPDELQVRDDPTLDCTGDGLIDTCTDETFTQSTGFTAPFGSASTVTLTVSNSPTPLFAVELTVEVRADLGSSLEYLTLSLNDTVVTYLLAFGGTDCPTDTQVVRLWLPADVYMELLDEDRTAVFELTASGAVSTLECPNSRARISLRMRTDVADCNANDIPDICELEDGDLDDDDGNGIPDTCDDSVPGDLNFDRRSDLAFFDVTTRRINYSYLDGRTVLSSAPAGGSTGSGWAPVGKGDFDADGQPDFVLRHPSKTEVRVWLMDGTVVASNTVVGSLNFTQWQFLTTADIDDDGDDDIIWRRSSDGRVVAWRMNGSLVQNFDLNSSSGLEWLGAGDVDGDGDSDLLWRRNSDRQLRIWIMDNGTVDSVEAIDGLATGVNTTWRVRGLADFNDDGNDDILWRNSSTGQLAYYFLDGAFLVDADVILQNPGTSRTVEQIGDIDGDGDPDLVIRTVGGNTVFGWIMDGVTVESTGTIRDLPAGATILR